MIVALYACTPPGSLDLGTGAAALYLGTDTDLGALVPLRGGFATVLVFDANPGADQTAINDAGVTAWVGRTPVATREVIDGVYLTDPADTFSLASVPGDAFGVAVDTPEASGALFAVLPPVLQLTADTLQPEAGVDLVVDLPIRWWDEYDYALAQLITLDGEVAWSNLPTGLSDWLDFVADPPRPRKLTIPPRATTESGALAVHFVRQLDADALFVGTLNVPASTMLGGTAWLVPVDAP